MWEDRRVTRTERGAPGKRRIALAAILFTFSIALTSAPVNAQDDATAAEQDGGGVASLQEGMLASLVANLRVEARHDRVRALHELVTYFTEDDVPNFAGSFYSQTKGYMEPLLKVYPTCLILRVRMPVSDDLSHRNFVTKIAKYQKVVNIPNSMTILHELLPASLAMAQKGLTGVYNFTNPGVISHNQVLDLYKKHVDPSFTYENFSVEEQSQILKADRSNNELDATKLLRDVPEGIEIHDILTAFDLCFQRMRINLEKEGIWPDNLPAEFRHKVHGGTGEAIAASEPVDPPAAADN